MKKFIYIALLAFFVTGLPAGEIIIHDDDDDNYEWHDDDENGISIEWDDARQTIKIEHDIKVFFKHKDLYITHEEEWDEVIITQEGELYVNDDKVRVSKKAKNIMQEYYELADASHDKIRNIAKAGAKIGVQGAALGLKAVINVVRLISPTYDGDDLEEDMEAEAEKIEEKGEAIEDEAEELEEILDHIKDVHDDLRKAVPELEKLEWF